MSTITTIILLLFGLGNQDPIDFPFGDNDPVTQESNECEPVGDECEPGDGGGHVGSNGEE